MRAERLRENVPETSCSALFPKGFLNSQNFSQEKLGIKHKLFHETCPRQSPLVKCSYVNFSCCCSVAKSCESMDCSMPGSPVLHCLLELLKLMSTESVMPFNYLNLCFPFLLLLSIFPRIRVISNELTLLIRWPKYWSFSISPCSKYSGLIF